MKNLMVSIVCLLLLLVPWIIYDKYSTEAISSYNYILENDVIPAVKGEDWSAAKSSFEELSKGWDRFEAISEYFIDTQAVNQVDKLIYKTNYHIEMQDRSNSAACSAELIQLLSCLHENEILSTGNIF